MAFSSGGGGDRRRRVLTEQVIGTAVAGKTPAAETQRQHGPRYAAEAVQPLAPLAGLVPMGRATVALWGMLAMLASVALLAGHVCLADLAPLVSDAHLDTFELTSRGSLASSFSAFTFLLATAWSLGIYSIRRHRTDDYKARYRVWVWLAAILGLASICVASGAHRPAMDLVSTALAPLGMPELTSWWLAPIALGLVYLGIRCALEVTESKLTVAALALTLTAWTSAWLLRPEWISATAEQALLLHHGLLLAGQSLLLLTLAIYGRHVRRDAAGLLAARPTSKKAARKAKVSRRKTDLEGGTDDDETQSAEPSRVQRRKEKAESKKTKSAKKKPAKEPAAAPAEEPEPETADDGGNWWEDDADDSGRPKRKLSKAERRRLRKQQSQQRHAA